MARPGVLRIRRPFARKAPLFGLGRYGDEATTARSARSGDRVRSRDRCLAAHDGPTGGAGSEHDCGGHPDLGGIWVDVYATPFERAPELGDREFATAEERAARDLAAMGNAGRDRREGIGTAQDVSGAYNAVYTSVKPAGPRTSLVVDPPNGRLPDLTAEAAQREQVQLEWRQALMRNTPTCQQGARGCEGGEYGPPSPRRFDTPPFYNTARMNRHDGPEDQSLSDRCMGGTTPDFNGFRRIVQGEESIAIGLIPGRGRDSSASSTCTGTIRRAKSVCATVTREGDGRATP